MIEGDQTSGSRPSALVWRNVLVILEFPHLGFGVPRFPWAGEVAEVEGGCQGRGAGGTGRPCCLRRRETPTFTFRVTRTPTH